MKRREFLQKTGVAATWAAVSITIISCGDDDNPTDPGSGGDGDVAGVVSTSAGHSHGGATVTGSR